MIKCPQCGAENFPGMAYCEQCGTTLPTPEAAPSPAPADTPAPAPPAVDGAAADAIAGAQALLDQLGEDPAHAAPSAAEATHTMSAPAGDTTPAADTAAAAAAPADTAAAGAAPADAAPADPQVSGVQAADVPPAAPVQAGGGFPQSATPLASLTITFSDNAQFTVSRDVTNVGRADIAQNWHPELDLIPFGGGDPNFGVSRHQAVIRRDGSAFSVLDVGSTNGTYVNGRMLEYNKAVDLHDGDTIAFGAFNAKISIGA